MIFKIILTVILFIALITLMYNVIVGVRINDDKLIVLCGIGSGLTGMLFGVVLGSILFSI
jgi:hypothetical protein